MKVAILYIGIGNYIDFWKGFYVSCENHFLIDVKKDYFVFTDAEKIFADEKVNKIYQADLGWPGNTLMRYAFFMSILDTLKNYDYIYFFNGNVLFLQDISKEEFCPKDDSLLVVEHHFFVDKPNEVFSYDRNEKSRAYIPMGEGEHYVCGGINGAKASIFIDFIKTLYENIEEDNKNGIVALWHDESHVNRYIIDHPQIELLPACYCYPELVANPDISMERKIICRDKRNYFNLYRFKNPEQEMDMLILDSQQLLEEKHFEKLEQRWLNLKAKGINLGEYFRTRDITHITIMKGGRLGDLFYAELMYKDVQVVKIIDEDYVDFYFGGGGFALSKDRRDKHFATVVTDTFRFSKIFEILVLRGEKNIISLEDVINTLYERYDGKLISNLNSFLMKSESQSNFMVDLNTFPVSELPEGSKVVLYGGGKVGKRFYSLMQQTPGVNVILWVDADYKNKQIEGLPIHNIDMIKDTAYDIIVLGTSVRQIADSMKETLRNKEIELKKVIWYNKISETWECV